MTEEIKKNELNEQQLETVSGGVSMPEGKEAKYQVGQEVIVLIHVEMGPACMGVIRRYRAVITAVSYGDQLNTFFTQGLSGVNGQGIIYDVRYLENCPLPSKGVPESCIQPA
ncbi:MAG: hypothetical protein PUC32_01305 [Oscillospiraceae bacterium]|nr:hypothetical protein [Oscillospiraceae bacterium]